MNILTTNKMQRYLSVFVLVLVGFQFIQETVLADASSPVIVEPYDEESIEKIHRLFTSIKSCQAKLMANGTALKEAAKKNVANPTPENHAELIKKTRKAINTNVEVLIKNEATLGRAIPEIRKYKEHLCKIVRRMEKQNRNGSLSEETMWAEGEVKALESFLNEMEEMRVDFRKLKQGYAVAVSEWVNSTHLEDVP